MSEHDLMTPAEVADRFQVSVRTVARWATAGRLRVLYTLGGHRRYPRRDVETLARIIAAEDRSRP